MSRNTAKVLDRLHGLGFTEVSQVTIEQEADRLTVSVMTTKGTFKKEFTKEEMPDFEAGDKLFHELREELRQYLDAKV